MAKDFAGRLKIYAISLRLSLDSAEQLRRFANSNSRAENLEYYRGQVEAYTIMMGRLCEQFPEIKKYLKSK